MTDTEISFACGVCSHKYKTRRGLRKHQRLTHEDTPSDIVCMECSTPFTERWRLKRHMREVHGQKDHKCPFCEMAFARESNRSAHIKAMHQSNIEELLDESRQEARGTADEIEKNIAAGRGVIIE